MCFTFAPVSVFAAEVNEPVISTSENTMIMPYAMDEPKTLGKLPYDATIKDLSAGYFTRTKYYFSTSTSRLKLVYDLKATRPTGSEYQRILEFRLYFRPKASSNAAWSEYAVKSVKFYNTVSSEITFDGLSNDNYYYFDFNNDSAFNSGWLLYNSISGSVSILE